MFVAQGHIRWSWKQNTARSTQLIPQSMFCHVLLGQTCNEEKWFLVTLDSANAVSVLFCTYIITVSSIQNCLLYKLKPDGLDSDF